MTTLIRRSSIFVILATFLLSGCGSFGNSIKKVAGKYVPFYEFNRTGIESVAVISDPDSNENLPVALDILFIFDEKTAKALSHLSGPDWFAGKQALLLKYQQKMVLSELEVVPQSAEQQIVLPEHFYKAIVVLLFANYFAPLGQYQADITQFNELKITLKKRGYVLEELNP